MSTHTLVNRAAKAGNPVIDGRTATVVWRGKKAPHLISDLHDWEEKPQPLNRVAPGVWAVSLTLPRDAYLEYAFYDPATKRRIPDPLNPNSIYNGLGGYNHFFYMPEATPTPLIRRKAGLPQGRLTRHRLEVEGMAVSRQRTVHLYRPPAPGPVPLLVVFDGDDYLRRGKIAQIVDNLIAQKRIPPIAMALLQNGGARGRMVEYACSEVTLAFLMAAVLPLARAELKLLDLRKHPGAFGVLGASMGGLMAVYTSLRLPEVFGRALSQSGAFELWKIETVVMQLARSIPRPDVRIWMDVGRFEWLLGCNRKMHKLLAAQGYDVTYREYQGAHNYTSWRDDVWRGLEALFG